MAGQEQTMKNRILMSVVGAAVLVPGTMLQASGGHFIILSGQSNMVKLSEKKDFRPVAEAAFPGEEITIVKVADGGQPISRWVKGWQSSSGETPEVSGDMYDEIFIKYRELNPGRPFSSFDTVTFVWMQGERDAGAGNADVYEKSLNSLLAQLQNDLGRKDVNMVVGRLSDWFAQRKNPETVKKWEALRAAQQGFVESYPRARLVNTDDLNGDANKKHYVGVGTTDDGQKYERGYGLMAQRYVKAILDVLDQFPIATKEQ